MSFYRIFINGFSFWKLMSFPLTICIREINLLYVSNPGYTQQHILELFIIKYNIIYLLVYILMHIESKFVKWNEQFLLKKRWKKFLYLFKTNELFICILMLSFKMIILVNPNKEQNIEKTTSELVNVIQQEKKVNYFNLCSIYEL